MMLEMIKYLLANIILYTSSLFYTIYLKYCSNIVLK